MRSLTQQQRKTLDVEIDMLVGNINRMCVTDDKKELESMYEYAKKRIDRICVINAQRFNGETDEQNSNRHRPKL